MGYHRQGMHCNTHGPALICLACLGAPAPAAQLGAWQPNPQRMKPTQGQDYAHTVHHTIRPNSKTTCLTKAHACMVQGSAAARCCVLQVYRGWRAL
jgi:hypothetical protein